jgi:hypothetical protein
MITLSDSKRLILIDDAEDPDTALGFARQANSAQDGPQGTSTSRSYAVPGIHASGTIVFSSLCVMAGLGVGGFLGLHAYVHRDDPPRSVVALPAASPMPQLALLAPQASSAGLTDAPRADIPPVSPSEPILARSLSKTARPAAVATTADKAAPSESASDNPY